MRAILPACLVAVALASGCQGPPLSIAEQASELSRAGDWQGAIVLTSESLAAKPDDAELLLVRGQAYVSTGKVELAIADFTAAIQLTPNESEPYYQRAVAYELLGDTSQAGADRQNGRGCDRLYADTFRKSSDEDPTYQAIQLAQSAEGRAAELGATELEQTISSSGELQSEESSAFSFRRNEVIEGESPRISAPRYPTASRIPASTQPEREKPRDPEKVAPRRPIVTFQVLPPAGALAGVNSSGPSSRDNVMDVHELSEIEFRRLGKYGVHRWQSPQFTAQFGSNDRRTNVQAPGSVDANARVKPLVVAPYLQSPAR